MFKSTLVAALSAVAYAQTPDLNTALSGNPNLSQLAALVGSIPGLGQTLGSANNITILAPNNAALGALLNTTAGKTLANNTAAVTALLQYHVLQGTIFASQIGNTPAFVPTLLNNPTYANVTGGQRVEAATANGNVTFFSGLLQNSTVAQANQNFTGGTIHVINKVLTLPANISTTLVTAGLTSLYGALNASSLLGTANGLKDVTIFAPANSAFQAIASGLGNVSSTDLAKIITYHVVNGTTPLYSTSLKNGTLPTVNGGNVNISLRGSNVFVNGAKVVTPNVLVAGGVVHVIDNVLNPANATATVSDGATTGAPAFSGASSASSVPFTSGAPAASTTVAGASSSSSKAAAQPMRTGAIGAAALFGAGAAWINL